MLKKLHKKVNTDSIDFEPKDGELTFLCSNESGMGSPSLDLLQEPPLENMELLVQFFELLLTIDRRINPDKYKKNREGNTSGKSIN